MANKIITLAIATRNDYTGLFFTINSALLAIRGTAFENSLDFSVVNNSDNAIALISIRDLCKKFNIERYSEVTNTFSNSLSRNQAVSQSLTEYTVLADSHVLFAHGFFNEYVSVLKFNKQIGLIHSPFTNGGMPTFRANCFYNLMKFHSNLHGTFSHRGASDVSYYPVALAPHAAYGFRTQEWLDFGGYMPECVNNGGGEPFVTYKYWMFGKSAYLTPRTNFIHFINVQYARKRKLWIRNHALSALALAGYDIGLTYLQKMNLMDRKNELWAIAKPYNDFIESRKIIPFDKLLDHFKEVKARPFI